MTEILSIDVDDARRAAFEKAALNLLLLDAEGTRIIQIIAAAFVDYDAWEPVEPSPYGDLDRVEGGEQILAFQDIVAAMNGDPELAGPLVPLAAARRKYQLARETAQAAEMEHRPKPRNRQVRPAAPVIRLVQPPPPDDSEP